MNAAEVLGALLRTNLAAGVAILGVITLRRIFRPRFGARLAYGLWLLPVLTGAAVLAPARQVMVAPAAAPVMITTASAHLTALASSSGQAMSLAAPALLVGVWLVGVAVAALVMARLQQRFMSRARRGAAGPAVVGVIAPRIVVPGDFVERYSREEQALVLAHERAHIARQDSRLNGLCAAAQCLCWFNPLVHLAARLMRIDQELACDEAVVARFPAARRAYAEVLVKAQLAIVPLPLGCHWPSKTQHPLVERIAMLRRNDVGAHRSAGLAAIAVLCAGAGLAAWAAQPADVRTIRPPEDAQPVQARPIAPRAEKMRAGEDLRAPNPAEAGVAPKLAKIVVGRGSALQIPAVAEARMLPVEPRKASPTTGSAAEADLGSNVSAPNLALLQATTSRRPVTQALADLQLSWPEVERLGDEGLSPAAPVHQRTPVATKVAVAPAIIKVSHDTLADDSDQMLCKVEAVTGSRFVRRVCMARSQWKAAQFQLFELERVLVLDPSGFPAGDY